MLKQYSINVRGLVQGVGFRPFIYRLASEMKINGTVSNRNSGVAILIHSTTEDCAVFTERIKSERPQASEITSITIDEQEATGIFDGFRIEASRGKDMRITGISPDIAVCDDCLQDIKEQDKRYKYAFVNCTNCGPRFSIIKSLPYDRNVTTMGGFKLCGSCASEFGDVTDRRFHAQPVCCNDCGPHYTMHDGEERITAYDKILSRVANILESDGIVAIKGVGGYNLICTPHSVKTVKRLRDIKRRRSKPFAVMFRDVDAVRRYASLSDEEEKLLSSWRRPIVLLNQKRPVGKGVNDGYRTIGAVLPYMPVHYHIFEAIKDDCILFTSANIGDLPIISANREALELFSEHSIAVVSHNRDIYNRVDDSVTALVANRETVMRRSRGYAPEALRIGGDCEGILAMGAEMNSSFAIGKGDEIILSQYIGDTKNRGTAEFYKEMQDHYFSMFRFTPQTVVCDCHPGYFSTRLAGAIARESGAKLLKVNHHHAHTAAVMAEYGISGEVLSLALDGIGYGDDGTLWGGELLLCTPRHYRRLMHLPQVAMPGGDAASHSPWRMAVSYLNAVYGSRREYPSSFAERVGEGDIQDIEKMIRSRINSPETSGAGRLFDAVSSLIGVCDNNGYQGEAAIILEQIAGNNRTRRYPIDKHNPLSIKLLFDGLLYDISVGVDRGTISATFHNTLAYMLKNAVLLKIKETGVKNIVLCGGVFQNKILAELLIKGLEENGATVFYPAKFPCNDGALAVGQLLIASQTV